MMQLSSHNRSTIRKTADNCMDCEGAAVFIKPCDTKGDIV